MGSSPYGHRYKTIRAALLGQPCALQLKCDGDPADSADHCPPLSRHQHVEGSDCCALRPACMACQHEQARVLSMETKRMRKIEAAPAAPARLVQSVEWA